VVVIICTNCRGASQVEETEIGRVVECPLCHRSTLAGTNEAVLPTAKPVQDAPYSLDDAPPLPRDERRDLEESPKQAKIKLVPLAISCAVTLLLMAMIYLAFHYPPSRYGRGEIPPGAWELFHPPEGHCSILMPGGPTGEAIPADGFAAFGGKLFVVKRWFEGVEVAFGWVDLDADKALDKRFEELAGGVRDRELKRLQGKTQEEARVIVAPKNGHHYEVRQYLINSDQGNEVLQVLFDPSQLRRHVEKETEMRDTVFPVIGPLVPIRLPFAYDKTVYDPGQRLRLYFALAEGNKKFKVDSEWVRKFFDSFMPE
jgi:hypothetical protein